MNKTVTLLLLLVSLCLPGLSEGMVSQPNGIRSFSEELQKKDRKKNKQEAQPVGNPGLLIDAKKEAITGNSKAAMDLFRQYTNRFPDDPVGFFELSRLEAGQKNFTEAARLCRIAYKLDPDNRWYALYLAELCQANLQYDEAIEIYQKILDRDPGNLDYLFQLASLYLEVEKFEEAIVIYDQIDQKAGVTEEISLQKQRIYLHLNDTKGAEREILKLIASNPAEPRYYSILAEFYLANNMPDKALETYLKVAAMDPDNAYIHMSLADYYRKTGNREKAYEELKLGFANPNLDVDTKVNILLSFYTVNQLYNDLKDEAFTLSKILMETHPRDPKVFSIYGDLLVQDNKFSEGRDAFLQVLALDSSRYAVWEQLLQLDLRLMDYGQLLSHGKRSIELFPDQPLPFLFTGLARLQLKEYEPAIKVLASGANLVADNNELLAEFYMYQADALHALKRDAEAFQGYERSLKLKEDNAYVLNNYAYYLSLDGNELDKAERMAKKAVTIEPENASFQDTYGWVLFKLKRYREAAEWILKAVTSREAPSAEVLEHYGDVLFHLDDIPGALEYWGRARDKGPASPVLEKKITDKKYYP